MNRAGAGIAAVAILASVGMSHAQDRPTYDSLWRSVTQNPACPPTNFPDFILVQCKGELTIWYFTRPNHPAHPGVIKREATMNDGAWYMGEQGWSFGPDSI